MSETDVVESVPVTKDPALVNGENGPLTPELQNGELSNGVHHEVSDGKDMAEPVNGDMNGAEDGGDDLMGEDDLPPPPDGGEAELPPPHPASSGDIQEELLTGDAAGEEELVQDNNELEDVKCAPVPAGVSEVDDLVDVSEGVGDVPVDNVQVNPAMDISDEELVSDSGLKEEREPEDQENQQNEAVEQQAEIPLVNISEPEPVEPAPEVLEEAPVEVEPVVEPEPEGVVEEEVPEMPEQSEPLVSVGYETVDVEMDNLPEVNIQPVPAADQGSSVDPIVTPEPPIQEDEAVIEPEVTEEVEQEPEPVPEPPQEEYQPQPEPVEVIEPEPSEPVCMIQPGIPEVSITHEEDDEPPVEQAQVGYAEPDIIVDNKPVEEEVQQQEVPPPPPPPLDEETPPPPPPLDENVPLKRDRRSGGSTPNKQSPSKEIIVTPTAPVVEDPVREPEPVVQEPVREPEPVAEIRQPEPEPVPVMEPVQILPVVVPTPAPSVPVTGEVSPPGSPSVVSEQALSDAGQGEPAEPHTSVSPQVSQKINKKNFKNKIKFGVDLVEAALKQLCFLGNVNKETGLFEEWLFKKAIRRYEAFWLPMAAEHKKESLAAPMDIEWMWHCHMLAPLAYEADCKNLVGIVVEHKLMSDKDRTKALEKSKKYWVAKYPNEPFEIELVYREPEPEPVPEPATEVQSAEEEATPEAQPNNTAVEQTEGAGEAEGVAPTASEEDTQTEQSEEQQEAAEQPAEQTTDQSTTEAPVEEKPAPAEPAVPLVPEEGYEQKCSYNIYSATKRQRVFYYQVSLPHFHDKNFLKAAVKRYQRFLFLKHQNPSEILAPCYDIDLMWHAHQLHPSVYKHDTVKVLGQILSHNDSINDRSTGSMLLRADQKTRELWKTQFEDSFVAYGSTFRGEPPVLCEKMSLIEPSEAFAFSTKKATVNLDKVQVEGLPEEVNKYSVKLAYGTMGGDGPLIKQFKGNKKKIEFENIKKGLAHFVFDTKEYDRLSFNMSQQIGFACTGHDEEIGQQWFNLMPVVENIPKSQSEAAPLTDTVTIDEENNLKATFSATIEPPKQGPTMLFLKNGNYETRFCIMPEQVVQMWGPIPLPRLPAGRDNHCVVASHKFINHTGEVTFTCRLIHSLPLLMSAVQVFFHSRMAAVAHLVGSDQIPLPSQLSDSKKIFSLNPAEGQRGILIKNQTGDWGLIRGQWTGFRKAQPAVAATKGKKAKKEVTWSPGTLTVSFYKIATGTWQHLSLPYNQDSYKFTIQDANVDLKTGSIQVNSESNEVAENLALAFSVALLHVVCQPRYTPPPPPEPIPVQPEAQATPPPASPPANQQEAPPAPESEEKPAEDAQEKTEEDQAAGGEAETQPEQPAAPVEPPVSPKSPTIKSAKSEPSTPSKKVKELPPIPTFELALVLAAGYNVDTATNDQIKKLYGQNACAGCVAVGMDVGVGQIGQATEVQAEVEVAEAAETGNGEVEEVGQDNIEMADGMDDGMEMGGDGMEGMDAMGDAGGAACGAF